MQFDKICPACASEYIAYFQEIRGRRTNALHIQYVCLDCKTFFHRSGYRESDEQKKYDFDFLIQQKDNHIAINTQLCLELKTLAPHARSCLEIGYGLGWFMQACKNFGFEKTYGFEVNPYCHKFASSELGLDCALGFFDHSHHETYDLIAAIMVFEHLENPRDLFDLMKTKLNPDGVIYISVPFFERRDWPFLKTANNPGDLPDLMHDNDVHINHFSVEGLAMMGQSLGARSTKHFVSQDVFWKSPGAFPGMLFRF